MRTRLMFIILIGSKVIYLICYFVINIMMLFQHAHWWHKVQEICKITLACVIIPNNLFTIYLYIYFYQLGMRTLKWIQMINQQESVTKARCILRLVTFVTIYQML